MSRFGRQLIGTKRGMTQVFTEDGNAVPVTVVELFPLTVTQLKTPEKEGYSAIQVGYQSVKEKHLSKPEQGHLKKTGQALFRHLKEFRLTPEEVQTYKVGDLIDASFLQPGHKVKATGISIGKGFQGNIRRWNQHRGPMSHGSKSHRLPGSIGSGTTPGRVIKGLRMAGKTGNKQVTIANLEVVRVLSPQENKQVVLIKGAVPGFEGTIVTLTPQKAG